MVELGKLSFYRPARNFANVCKSIRETAHAVGADGGGDEGMSLPESRAGSTQADRPDDPTECAGEGGQGDQVTEWRLDRIDKRLSERTAERPFDPIE